MGSIGRASWETDQVLRNGLAITPDTDRLFLERSRDSNVAFSPNQNYLVTPAKDGYFQIFDLKTSQAQTLSLGKTVRIAAFSPNSKLLAIAGESEIFIIDPQNGQELRHLSLQDTEDIYIHMEDVVFSPDNQYLLTLSTNLREKQMETSPFGNIEIPYMSRISGPYLETVDTTVQLWNSSTGEKTFHLNHAGYVQTAAFSPDSRYVATAGKTDNTAIIWDAATGKKVLALDHDSSVNDLAFSPDGHYLVTTSGDSVQMWNTSNGKLLQRFTHEGAFHVAFSSDGKYVATANGRSLRRFWCQVGCLLEDAQKSQTIRVYSTDEGWEKSGWEDASITTTGRGFINKLVFSSNGKYIATASDDRTARVWEMNEQSWGVRSLREVSRMPHLAAVNSVAFSPDDLWLATASTHDGESPNTALLWKINYDIGEGLPALVHEGKVRNIQYSLGGNYLATVSTDRVSVENNQEVNIVKVWQLVGERRNNAVFEGLLDSAKFSQNEQYFAATSGRSIYVWNTSDFRRPWMDYSFDLPVSSFTFSPNGEYLAAVSSKNVVVLNIKEKQIQLSTPSDSEITSVTFSQESRYIAVATAGNAFILDISNGKILHNLTHTGTISKLAFSPDNKYLATVSNNNQVVKLWTLSDGEEIASVNLEGTVKELSFSPDGNYLVTTVEGDSKDGKNRAQVWDVKSGQELAYLDPHEGAPISGAMSIVFSDDSNYLAVSENNIVLVWNTLTKQEVQRFEHQYLGPSLPSVATLTVVNGVARTVFDNSPSFVNDIAFSSDSKYIATASDDNTARIWEINNGQELARLNHYEDVYNVIFSNDEKVLITTSRNTVHQWLWQHENLLEAMCSVLPRNLSLSEWNTYVGSELYQSTCPNLSSP